MAKTNYFSVDFSWERLFIFKQNTCCICKRKRCIRNTVYSSGFAQNLHILLKRTNTLHHKHGCFMQSSSLCLRSPILTDSASTNQLWRDVKIDFD